VGQGPEGGKLYCFGCKEGVGWTYSCRLDSDVAAALTGPEGIPSFTLSQGGFLTLGVFGLGVLGRELGLGGPGPVHVVGFGVGWVEMCEGAGDEKAPVALRRVNMGIDDLWAMDDLGLTWTYTLSD